MMKTTFFINSKQRNSYFVNLQKKHISLVHPYLTFIYLQRDSTLSEDIKRNIDYDYYTMKIAYFKKYGILSETPMSANKQMYLTPELIEESIGNIKQVVFETTEKCNLRCKYCYYGEYYQTDSNRDNKNMPVEYAQNVLNYIEEKQFARFNQSINNPIYISFFGGEPLLNTPFIESVIKNIKLKHRKIIYSMTTNATLLDKYISLLVDNDIQILVSLDGNEDNNQYRIFRGGKNSFKKIMSNLQLLNQQHPRYYNKNVNFNAVLHNKNSLKEIYDFFKTNFDKYPAIGELNNSGIADKNENEFQTIYRNKTENLLQMENYANLENELFLTIPSYHSALIFLHQYLQFSYKSYEDLLKGSKMQLLTSTGTCLPFSKKMFVMADGKILPCEKIGQKYALGKVDKKGVHLDTSKIAEIYNKYYKTLEKKCAVCYRQQACTQCVFFLKEHEKDFICHGFLSESNMRRYLANNISFFEMHSSDYSRMMKDVIVS